MNPIPDNIGIPRHLGGKNKDSTEELEIKFEAYNALYLYF